MTTKEPTDDPPRTIRAWKPREAEWLALFPTAPGHRASSESHLSDFGDSAEIDLAANLRRESPITREVLNRELAPYPMLRFAMNAELALGPLGKRGGLLYTVIYVISLALNGPVYQFNDGRFQTRDLVVMTAMEFFVSIVVGVPTNFAAKGAYNIHADPEQTVAVSFIRWAQALYPTDAVAETNGEPKLSTGTIGSASLFEHIQDDDHCPCPRIECAGGIPIRAGRLLVAEKGFRTISMAYFNWTAALFTSLITFGYFTWRTWYWALLATFMYSWGSVYFLVLGMGIRIASTPLLELTHRLQIRAVKLTLGELFSHLRKQLDSSSHLDSESPQDYSDAMTRFIDIQNQLLPYLSFRTHYLSAGKSWAIILIGIALIAEIIFIATGGCLTQWPLTSIIGFIIVFFTDLLNISAGNAKLDELAQVYRSTRNKIREIVWLASRTDDADGPSPRKTKALGDLAHLDSLLSAYYDTSQYQGKFVGFVVTYGFTRTLFVTFFTLVLGFWTVLKGLGIFVTAEQACPIRQ